MGDPALPPSILTGASVVAAASITERRAKALVPASDLAIQEDGIIASSVRSPAARAGASGPEFCGHLHQTGGIEIAVRHDAHCCTFFLWQIGDVGRS